MNCSFQQIIYNTLFAIAFVFLALLSSEANFLPLDNIWSIAILGIFVVSHAYIFSNKKDWYYNVSIQNKGGLYSHAVILFVLEFISYLNSKENFLSSPSTMEVFKCMITLILFLSIIRVIRPLSRDEWWAKK